jgi:hypothetical protein
MIALSLEEQQLLDHIREHREELQRTLFYLVLNHPKDLPSPPEPIYSLYLFIGEMKN